MQKVSIDSRDISLQPVTPEDIDFLYGLYFADKISEFKSLGLPDKAIDSLLKMQFHAQQNHYQRHFPDAEFYVITHSGVPVGQFALNRSMDEIRIIDICIHMNYRSQGIGKSVLEGVLSESRSQKKKISLHVRISNRAKQLYERLGFNILANRDPYDYLVYEPQK